MISDVLSDAVSDIFDYLREDAFADAYREARDETAVVVAFMDALRLAFDLPPTEWGDAHRRVLIGKILEAASVAHDLGALRMRIYDDAARLRAIRRFEDDHEADQNHVTG